MPSQEEFNRIVSKANAGDAAALKRLRTLLDSHPEIWQQIGDLGKHAEAALIKLVAKDNVLAREAILKQLAEMRANLCSPRCTKLEEVLIDRFVLTWLQLQYFTASLPVYGDGQSIAGGKFVMGLRESAQRQLNAALQAIATYRKLQPSRFAGGRSTVPFPAGEQQG
jgi:hypothetical protein